MTGAPMIMIQSAMRKTTVNVACAEVRPCRQRNLHKQQVHGQNGLRVPVSFTDLKTLMRRLLVNGIV